VTFLGATVRLEVVVHGRALWADVPHAHARGLERKKSVVLAFAPEDCVVLPAGAPAEGGSA